MKILSWNVRGLNNPRTFRVVLDVLRRRSPDVIFLSEIRCDHSRIVALKTSLNLFNCFSVSSQWAGGGICILWNANVDISIISSSPYFIDTNVSFDSKNWRFTGFYGQPEAHKRTESWSLLKSLYSDNNDPWLVSGDLNEIMWQKEKKGGNLRNSNQLLDFRETLDECGLSDLGFIGDPFTWCNKWKNKDPIFCRLDKFVGNSSFINLVSNISNLHLDWCRSDHRPIELSISVSASRKRSKGMPRRFKFEEHWSSHPNCHQ